MAAVPESALASAGGNLLERLPDAILGVPHLEFPHPRRVDDHAATWHHQHLPVHAGVPPTGVPVADLAGGKGLRADESIHERGLPRPGWAEDSERYALTQVGREGVEPDPGGRAHGVNRNVTGDRRNLSDVACDVLCQVVFVEDHDWRNVALPGEGDVTLDRAGLRG